MSINKNKIYALLNEFKNRINEEKDTLSLYIITFSDTFTDYTENDVKLEIEQLTLYQYLDMEVSNFIGSKPLFTDPIRSDNFLETLFSDHISIYKINQYTLKEIINNSVICRKRINSFGSCIVRHFILNDSYLVSFFDYMCDLYSILKEEYKDAYQKNKTIIEKDVNIKYDIQNTISELSNTTDIINFYNYLQKAINNYKIKKGRD